MAPGQPRQDRLHSPLQGEEGGGAAVRRRPGLRGYRHRRGEVLRSLRHRRGDSAGAQGATDCRQPQGGAFHLASAGERLQGRICCPSQQGPVQDRALPDAEGDFRSGGERPGGQEIPAKGSV